MTFERDLHHRRSIRLRGYDYSAGGAYFVTICVQGRESLLGEIVAGEMRLNDAGRMVTGWWGRLPERFPAVVLDEFVVMPNHVHGIVIINDVGAGSPRPEGFPRPESIDEDTNRGGETPPLHKQTLGQIVGFFKFQSTKEINLIRDSPGVPLWQRNYYERIIRDEVELTAVREYIRNNPADWATDDDNPVNA